MHVKNNKQIGFGCILLTCDLGLNLPLHLQRVDENAAVADEAGAGDASVRLAESIFGKAVAERGERRKRGRLKFV